MKKDRLALPQLEIEELFYLEVKCAPILPVGTTGKGELNIYPIAGGYFEGEKISGTILPIGADWNYFQADKIDVVDTRYVLQTDDGAMISISTKGCCILTPEQDEIVCKGGHIEPEDYYFRQHLFFETGAEKYQWLNGIIAFAVMGIKPTGEICYNAYMVK